MAYKILMQFSTKVNNLFLKHMDANVQKGSQITRHGKCNYKELLLRISHLPALTDGIRKRSQLVSRDIEQFQLL